MLLKNNHLSPERLRSLQSILEPSSEPFFPLRVVTEYKVYIKFKTLK